MNEHFFNQGKTFEEYAEPSDFEGAFESISISDEDCDFFQSFKVRILVISEKWCGDCRREVPLLALIADRARWDLRVFSRDENPDLMEKYLTNGKKVIPVFVFYDEDFSEIGRFIEKAPAGKSTLDVVKEILGTYEHHRSALGPHKETARAGSNPRT